MSRITSLKTYERFVDTVPGLRKIAMEEGEPSTPYQELAGFFGHVLGDIHRDDKLLKSLYVHGRTRAWDNNFLPANLYCMAPAEVERIMETAKPIEFAGSLLANRCIYLIAPVGQGKTTFLHYQLKVEIPKIFRKKGWRTRLAPIIFDVRKECIKPDDFEPRLLKMIDSKIDRAFPFLNRARATEPTVHRAYCAAFKDDLEEAWVRSDSHPPLENPELYEAQVKVFQDLREKDPLTFNAKRIRYARTRQDGRDVHVVLVVDNADQQLPFPGGEEIIIASHTIADKLECPLILSLRDTSFKINNPAFAQSAFRPRYLNLSRANSSSMMGKRMAMLRGFTPDNAKVTPFVDAIASQLSNEEIQSRKRVTELIDGWGTLLANRSLRNLLALTELLLSSHHITSTRFELLRSSTDDYLSPEFETLLAKIKMALILGQHRYFNDESDTTYVLNLFDSGKTDIPLRNMLRLKLLQFLQSRGDTGSTPNEIISLAVPILGERVEPQIKHTLKRFVEKGLAVLVSESEDFRGALLRQPINIDDHMHDRMYIAHTGLFHLNTLVHDDIYLDEMKFATYMPREKLEKVFRHYREYDHPNRPLRHQSTHEFLFYLEECEQDKLCTRLSKKLEVPPIMESIHRSYRQAEQRIDEHWDKQRSRRLKSGRMA